MTSGKRITRHQLAARLASDIADGTYVNLGIGAPTLVADYIPAGREVILHTENGLLGMGKPPEHGSIDPDLINAGKEPVTAIPGAAFFDQADSFAMIRGGHIDLCILGAFQVSETGDVANWSTDDANAIPAVGGAMDLAVGAKEVHVMMDLLTSTGTPKLVSQCSLPVTGFGCVSRVYTDHAIFEVTAHGFAVTELFQGNTITELEELTGLTLLRSVDA